MPWLRGERPDRRPSQEEPTYLVERDAPSGAPLDPTTRWFRRAIERVRGPTYDAYPDHIDVPWHVVGPSGPTVPAERARRIPKPRTHPVSLYVKRYGRLREVKLMGLPLEVAIDRLNRRIMAGWVMQEIANTLAQMEEEDMLLEHRRDDDKGQGLAEYALILALIAIVAIAALLLLGSQIQGVIQSIADCLPGGVGC